MNGRVERMRATWRYEFYGVYDPPNQIERVNPLIDAFAERYNHHRPRDTLDQRTPLDYRSTRDSDDPLKHARPSRMS